MKRRYPTIDHRHGPQAEYDDVVIGAGIGGLIAGNLLARTGRRVLMVEQHSVVGGYCSTFRRRGFVFDAASHFYPLLGNPATESGKLLADLGVNTSWIKMDPVDCFHLPDGTSFSVSADFNSYLNELKQAFPDEAEAIDRFFALSRQLYLWGVLHYFRNKSTSRLDKYLNMTVRDALDQFFDSPRLKLLLTADCPHWGAPPERTSFVFDSMLRLSYFEGNYYPRGGSQRFADELARRFVEQGGQILMNSPVQKLEVRDNCVRAVVVQMGRQNPQRVCSVSTKSVVSNADMRLTLERLIDPRLLPVEYMASIHRLRPTCSCFLAHIGVAGISRDQLAGLHGYYWRDWNPDDLVRGAFDFKVFVPTLYDDTIAKMDRHVVIVQKVTDVDISDVEDWQVYKNEIESFVMQELERRLPGFSDRIEVCESATAKTSHRFTLNHQGAMLGWEMSPGQLGSGRPAIVSPVSGLFFVGHWTQPGGGITPVIISAMRAADAVLESNHRNQEAMHAG